MKDTTLSYYSINLLLSDGLVVLDEEGTIYYLSLGKWHALVDAVKKDFRSTKKYTLKAGGETGNTAVQKSRDTIVQMLEEPIKIDVLKKDINYKYIFGTPLQQKVWDYLGDKVTFDARSTYAKVAKDMGRVNGARAVGNACAANKIALIVPCHRVLTTLGEITGYRWGTTLKRRLLNLEAGKTVQT